MGFVCIDKRKKNPQTGQFIILMDKGYQHPLPPCISLVPSLLLNEKRNVICGDEIMKYLQPIVRRQTDVAQSHQGEPMAYASVSSGSGVVSEAFTFYNANGAMGLSNTANYVSADHNIKPIYTEPDTYKPNKLPQDLKIATIESDRATEIPKINEQEMDMMLKNATQNRENDNNTVKRDLKYSPQI